MPLLNEFRTYAFNDAILFLNNHPALNYGNSTFFRDNLYWEAVPVCKHGIVKLDERASDIPVSIFRGKNPKLFQAFFDCRLNKDDDISRKMVNSDGLLDSIDVPYSLVYGHKWEYSKTVWNGEYSFYKFVGKLKNVKRRLRNESKRFEWSAYAGGDVSANSFDDMIFEIYRDVLNKYGNFNGGKLYTDKEKENHLEEKTPFYFVDHIDGNGREYSTVITNENWIKVTEEEINLRWWNWYRTTAHYTNNWTGE